MRSERKSISDEKAKQKENERASEAILISAEQILNEFEFEEHNSRSSSPVTRTSPNSSPDASTSGSELQTLSTGSRSDKSSGFGPGASPSFSRTERTLSAGGESDSSSGSGPGASLFIRSEQTLSTGDGSANYSGSGASPLFSGSLGSGPGASHLFRKSEPTLFTGFGLGGYNGSGPGI